MDDSHSRRAFLAGALLTGTMAAGATYYSPGGRAGRINFSSGEDVTGARDLLLDLWRQANPLTSVNVLPLNDSTIDQQSSFLSSIKGGAVDVVNLDIIDLPRFRAEGLIVPIELDRTDEFLGRTLAAATAGDPDPTRYWAAPFNADVGMLFHRGVDSASTDPPGLFAALQNAAAGQFVGQLEPGPSSSAEAFVVNILEHALSQDPTILDATTGFPSYDVNRWNNALAPLGQALVAGRVAATQSEKESRENFQLYGLKIMRNWPVKYRELQQYNDTDGRASRIRVGSLPTGILGGQFLALAHNSAQPQLAKQLIKFLVSTPAQKILASYGLPPTRKTAYSGEIKAVVPHLTDVLTAVENAQIRPVSPRYQEASTVMFEYLKPYVESPGSKLPAAFTTDLAAALK